MLHWDANEKSLLFSIRRCWWCLCSVWKWISVPFSSSKQAECEMKSFFVSIAIECVLFVHTNWMHFSCHAPNPAGYFEKTLGDGTHLRPISAPWIRSARLFSLLQNSFANQNTSQVNSITRRAEINKEKRHQSAASNATHSREEMVEERCQRSCDYQPRTLHLIWWLRFH